MKEAEQIDLMMASIHMHKHSTLTFRKLVMMKTYAVMKKQHRLPEYIDELGLVIILIKENVDFPYGVMLKEGPQDEKIEYFIKEAGKKLRMFWRP